MGRKGTRQAGPDPVRQTVTLAVALVIALTLMPMALVRGGPLYIREPGEGLAENLPAGESAVPLTSARDKGKAVRLQMADGNVRELTMEEYLWSVVAAEMPASFEEEALKAQACAARTYTLVQQGMAKHEGADLCADSTCCQAYVEREAALARWGLNAGEYEDKITRAVTETDGLGVLYGGKPIQALFFSSAAGRTVDAVAVWGNCLDYLVSVDSPEGEEVPNYTSQVVLSAQQVKELTLAAYPGADLSGEAAGWFGNIQRSGQTVTSLSLGGLTLTGGQVRKLFSLRSAAFTVDWDGANFTFSVTGYGHGVGMSQYGANALAGEGKTFRDILTWYYTGTEVDHLW